MKNFEHVNYNSVSSLRSFLREEGLGMRKKFGQNFLINPAVRIALVDALDCDSGAQVWEIGPGLGAMTSLLLEKNLKVRAFEIDSGFSGVLKRIFSNDENFTLIEGDVMKTWKEQEDASFLLGNLPYNIAAALLADFIENRRFFKRIVVTVQKEVALRMAASAGSKDYSSFSVLCSSFYKVKLLMVIRPASFYPQPNVDSMGVLLEGKTDSALNEIPKAFFPLVRSLFSSRRKTIRNNLLSFLSSKDLCARVLSENALTGSERAEDLESEAFFSLAKSIANMRLYSKDVNS